MNHLDPNILPVVVRLVRLGGLLGLLVLLALWLSPPIFQGGIALGELTTSKTTNVFIDQLAGWFQEASFGACFGWVAVGLGVFLWVPGLSLLGERRVAPGRSDLGTARILVSALVLASLFLAFAALRLRGPELLVLDRGWMEIFRWQRLPGLLVRIGLLAAGIELARRALLARVRAGPAGGGAADLLACGGIAGFFTALWWLAGWGSLGVEFLPGENDARRRLAIAAWDFVRDGRGFFAFVFPQLMIQCALTLLNRDCGWRTAFAVHAGWSIGLAVLPLAPPAQPASPQPWDFSGIGGSLGEGISAWIAGGVILSSWWAARAGTRNQSTA